MDYFYKFMEVDDKDLQIINVLKKDARASSQTISNQTGIPITTVHYRLKNLKKTGVIKGYTIRLDHEKIGKGLLVYTVVYLNLEIMNNKKIKEDDIDKSFMKIECVEKGDIIIGDGYVLLQIRVKDQKEYKDFLLHKLQQIEGVKETKSMVAIEEFEK